MKSVHSKKYSPRRKFFLPILLILFILAVLGINKFGKLAVSFDFNWPTHKIANPQPSPNQEIVLQETLAQYGMLGKEIKIANDEAVASVSGTIAFFNLKENLERQVVSLQFILSRAKIEGKLPRSVDLRFDKPVVSY